jgi:hypothetical protein
VYDFQSDTLVEITGDQFTDSEFNRIILGDIDGDNMEEITATRFTGTVPEIVIFNYLSGSYQNQLVERNRTSFANERS